MPFTSKKLSSQTMRLNYIWLKLFLILNSKTLINDITENKNDTCKFKKYISLSKYSLNYEQHEMSLLDHNHDLILGLNPHSQPLNLPCAHLIKQFRA